MKAVKRGDAFLIYALPSLDVEPRPHGILSQYQEFKDATILKKRFITSLATQFLNCKIHLQLILFICYEC
jgi:hypothetical protein